MMTAYEQEPEVACSGLHVSNVCSLTNDCSSTMVTFYDKDLSQIEYVKEDYCDSRHVNIENDEVIAHTFQEELSRVAAAEASGYSRNGENSQGLSVVGQHWYGALHRDSNSENEEQESCKEEAAALWDNFSSTLSLGEASVDGRNHLGQPEIEDESTLDGEVGKRLYQMVPIPHIPRINGEIPPEDEAMTDHQRLLERLQFYDLIELKIKGDGNCQFRSLSDQIYRSSEHHKFVRQQVVDQLKCHPELYEGYLPMPFDEYLKKMSKTGEWGDHVTLQAAADSYGFKILILTSFRDTCYIEILPRTQKSNRIIFLSFWAEVHYNSIYPQGDLPEVEHEKKKGSFWPGSW